MIGRGLARACHLGSARFPATFSAAAAPAFARFPAAANITTVARFPAAAARLSQPAFRFFSTDADGLISEAELIRRTEDINELFVTARDEIEFAEESMGTSYYDDDVSIYVSPSLYFGGLSQSSHVGTRGFASSTHTPACPSMPPSEALPIRRRKCACSAFPPHPSLTPSTLSLKQTRSRTLSNVHVPRRSLRWRRWGRRGMRSTCCRRS